MEFADSIKEIKAQKGSNFESLKGKSKGFYSVRVDQKYRLILTLEKDQSLGITEIIFVNDRTNHYQ